MASLPAFSYFSAASELAVTAAIYYVLWRAWRHDDFRGGLLAITLAFEVLVNVTYMSIRIASPAPELTFSPWMTALLAGHGTLSLLMLTGLIALSVEAIRAHRHGRNTLRERPRATLAFAVLWAISVLSGEAIFVLALLR